MNEHHQAWLDKHPGKEEFLQQALENGFDIHHVNGDHYDNRHENLVLIYSKDHHGLHNLTLPERPALESLCLTKGQKAYEARLKGISWADVTAIHGTYSLLAAKNYAKKNNKEWPPYVKRAKRRSPKTIARLEKINPRKVY